MLAIGPPGVGNTMLAVALGHAAVDADSTDEDDVARLSSETENTGFLASLGFRPFRDRLWLLDLAMEDAAETLGAIRRGTSHA